MVAWHRYVKYGCECCVPCKCAWVGHLRLSATRDEECTSRYGSSMVSNSLFFAFFTLTVSRLAQVRGRHAFLPMTDEDNATNKADGLNALSVFDARATTLLRRRTTCQENFTINGTRLLEVQDGVLRNAGNDATTLLHHTTTHLTSPHLTSPHLTSPHFTSPSHHLTHTSTQKTKVLVGRNNDLFFRILIHLPDVEKSD